MRKYFLQLHIAVFLAGFTAILGRLIELNEAVLVWYRLLISAATLWIIYGFSGRLNKISKADRWLVFAGGAIAAMHWVCFFGAIKFANVSVALVCFSAVGFFTAVLEPLMTRRKMAGAELALGLLCVAGIAIIFHFDPQYKTGIVLGIFSAALGAFFPILNRQLLQRMNSETLITYQLSGGVLALSLLLPLYLQLSPAPRLLPAASDWPWLLMLAWLCSVWAFQLSSNALRKISAFTVNLSYNLEPVYGILLAFLFFQENQLLSTGFYVGLLLIVLSVALQSWRVIRSRGRS